MKWIKEIAQIAPFAWISIAIDVLPMGRYFWLRPTLLLAVALAGLFQKNLYLQEGNLPKRKRLELAFCGILFVSSLATLNPVFTFWPLVPFFLLLVWMHFSALHLLLLTSFVAVFSYFQFHTLFEPNQYGILMLVIVCSLLFRFVERQKQTKLQQRLQAFETFEQRISSPTINMDPLKQLQVKKELKIGELVKKQEERFVQFADLIDSAFSPHSVLIYTFDPLQEEFHLQASKSPDELDHRTQSLLGFFKAAHMYGRALVFHSKSEIKDLPYYQETPNLASVIVCPIFHQDLLMGMILVDHANVVFEKHAAEVLDRIAESIANFIYDSQTIYSYFKLKEELSSFYTASSSLNQTFHLQDVHDTFLKTSYNIVDFDLAFLVMTDANTKYNRIVAQYGEYDDWIGETFALSSSKGLISWVIENRKPLFYEDYSDRHEHSPLFHKKMKLPNIFQSACLFPLEVKEEIMGAVVFFEQR